MKQLIFLLFIIVAIAFFYYYKNTNQINKQVLPAQIGLRTKISGCQVNNSLPDSACTPGATDMQVTQYNIHQTICVAGYSSSIRNVPSEEKKGVYQEYGIYSHHTGEYEIDHLISLELGGSNDIANLWPEAAEPRPGFHEKDMVENYLHEQVCNGAISLSNAQKEIATNWLQVYNNVPNIQDYEYNALRSHSQKK